VHMALGLAREDIEQSAGPILRVLRAPRGARLQVKRRPLRRIESAGRVVRPLLPPLQRRAGARTLWRRFRDDRELVAVKISLLIGMGVLAAVLEWVG
jgi:hypothetical protein